MVVPGEKRTEAMNNPNIAPRPPPITPAMTVLPRHDSMPICIYTLVRNISYRFSVNVTYRLHHLLLLV